MSVSTIPLTEQNKPKKFTGLGAQNRVKVTTETSHGITAASTFSKGTPFSTDAITPSLYFKYSDSSQICANPLYGLTVANPLTMNAKQKFHAPGTPPTRAPEASRLPRRPSPLKVQRSPTAFVPEPLPSVNSDVSRRAASSSSEGSPSGDSSMRWLLSSRTNLINVGNIAANNLDKTEGSKPVLSSVPASPQTSKATAHPESTTASNCNSADQTCLNSYFTPVFLENPNQCSLFDPARISNRVEKARIACQGEKVWGVSLDAVFTSKQSKTVPNLEGNLDSHADPVASRSNGTTEKVYSKKKFNPCDRILEDLAKNFTKFKESSNFRNMQIFQPPPGAQIMSLNETVCYECDQQFWYQLCGPLTFTVVDSPSEPFEGLAWANAEHTHIKGRKLQTVPSTPSAPGTIVSGSNVYINWNDPYNGGSVITQYIVLIANSNGAFTAYTGCGGSASGCLVPMISVLKQSPYGLANGASVYAQVQAINAIGPSALSQGGNGAKIPTAPSTPSAPTTSISGSDVVINWVAPANGGSAITGYNVEIQRWTGVFTAYTSCTGIAVSCTVPISVLQAAPYNLAGASVQAKVQAINAFGTSAASSAGNGAILPSAAPSTPTAPSTSISGSDVIINWVAPANGGSAITEYNLEILQSDTTYTTHTSCTGIAVSCSVPISVLQAAPYNLANGASVYARVTATNAIGSSAVSPAGNGAAIPTAPSTPAAPTTTISGSNVIINWVAPANGGSVITGYNVEILQSDGTTKTAYTSCTGTAVSCSVLISVLQAAPYNLANGASVYAQVQAINAFGTSAASFQGNGAAIPIAPSVPAAPTTVISGSDVIINWVAPANGGSVITGYNVEILQSDGTTKTAYTSCTGTAVSCSVLISVLQAAPYNLANGASVYAQVQAINAFGTSAASFQGNGAAIPIAPSVPAAPTTVISGSDVIINWVAPANGGSVITEYNLEIRQSDGTTYTAYTGCTGTAVSCSVLISVLQAAPYNLANLASVYTKVQAINAFGTSAASSQGNGAIIPATVPSTPSAPTTSNSVSIVIINWVAPYDRGSAITGYNVLIRQSDGTTYTTHTGCTGTAVSCSVSISVLQAAPYNLANGASVYARVTATNAIGSSAASPAGNGAAIPTAPSTPSAPNNSISGSNVLINWVAPADGGSAITGYTVEIQQSDGTTFTALASCSGTTISCQISITVLKSAPYNLAEGASIYALVIATNLFGSSSASTPGNGAVIVSQNQSMILPSIKLNAVIGKETSLLLPEINGVTYIVLGKPHYQVSVNGFLLKVKSDSDSDIGSHNLQINAKTSGQSGNITVNVIFSNVTTTAETAISAKQKTKYLVLSVQESDSLLKTTTSCNTTEAGILPCVTDIEYYYSIDPSKTTNTAQSEVLPERPTMSVSRVNSRGSFFIKFSQAMNILALKNSTNDRQLQEVNATTQNETLDKYLYLLSPKHLHIEVKSKNATKAKFTWNAKNITSTNIEMQLVFQDPLSISNDRSSRDMLEITVLPPALRYFQTLASGALTKNPLQTLALRLPPQSILGPVMNSVSKVAKIVEESGQYTALANIAAQLAVSGSMGSMWSMVNAFKIVNTFNYLETNAPGNVRHVMNNLNDMLELSALETGQITSNLFNFTETKSPGAGFNEMGNDSKVLTEFIGIQFYIGVLLLTVYLLYGFVHCCSYSDRRCNRFDLWLQPKLIWSALICYQLETSLDFSIGTLLKFEEPNLNTISDIFDLGFSIAAVICLLALPLTQVIYLCKNKGQIDGLKFKQKWGSLYSELKTSTPSQRETAIKMFFWFLFRRILTALNLVELRNQTVWIQLTLNMWLCLADACLILHWSPYKNPTRDIMEKFNGAVVLLLSQLVWMQTDLVPSAEDRYYIGWYYLGAITIMFVANISVVVISALKYPKDKFKRYLFSRKKNKALAKKLAQRDYMLAYKKKMEAQKNGLPESLDARPTQNHEETGLIVVKPRAVTFQNGLNAIHEQSLDQIKKIRREKRQLKKDASLAQRLAREMDNELSEIAELDEEIQQSFRAVRNDIEAQIRKKSQVQQKPQPQLAKRRIKPRNKVPSFNQVQEPNRRMSIQQGRLQTEEKPLRIRQAMRMIEQCKVQKDALDKLIIKEERKQQVFNQLLRQKNEKVLHK